MLLESRMHTARALVLQEPRATGTPNLRLRSIDLPQLRKTDVLLEIRACGVCRTDLHIVQGDLPEHRAHVVPGHQIVGTIIDRGSEVTHSLGTRVGVSWLGGVDGSCRYCKDGRENLCDSPTFTGYDIHGGFATHAVARGDFVFPLDDALSDVQAAPLLCAGIIGFRALQVAGVRPGDTVGLFGFGSSAHLAVPVLKSWGCKIFVSTRGAKHRALADSLGVDWIGDAHEPSPVELDRAVTFAPAGDVVVSALRSLRKGGVVAVNAIHLDRIPEFDYDSLLRGEREIRSVTNMTRRDAREFLALAASLRIRPEVTVFSMDHAIDALRAMQNDRIVGSAVLVMPIIDAS